METIGEVSSSPQLHAGTSDYLSRVQLLLCIPSLLLSY